MSQASLRCIKQSICASGSLLSPTERHAGLKAALSRTTPHGPRRPRRRPYYTASDPTQPHFPPVENAILSAAISHVPELGFTQQSLIRGAQDAGYLPASTGLFTRGPFDLVLYHLIDQRVALKNVFGPTVESGLSENEAPARALGVTAKLRMLMIARLRANKPVIHKYQEALALMSLASNIPPSVAELGCLSDELWYLAGDKSVDSSWYTKRGSLAGVYASTEVYMTQDQSSEFVDTESFLDRRLEDARSIGATAGSVGQWVGFAGLSTVNVLRSWGARI